MWSNLRGEKEKIEKGWGEKTLPFLGLFIIWDWLGTGLSFLTAEGGAKFGSSSGFQSLMISSPWLLVQNHGAPGPLFILWVRQKVLSHNHKIITAQTTCSVIQDHFSPMLVLPVLLHWLHRDPLKSFSSFRIVFWHGSWWMKIASLIILFPVCFNYASFPVGVKWLFWSHWFEARKTCISLCIRGLCKEKEEPLPHSWGTSLCQPA